MYLECVYTLFVSTPLHHTTQTTSRNCLNAADLMQVYGPAVAALRAAGIPEATIQQRVNEAIACKTTMFSPAILLRAGVPVTRIVQKAGEIVVTFPRGYHAGFSTGTNIGEAANFALRNWAEFGVDGAVRALHLKTTPVRSLPRFAPAPALHLLHLGAPSCGGIELNPGNSSAKSVVSGAKPQSVWHCTFGRAGANMLATVPYCNTVSCGQ